MVVSVVDGDTVDMVFADGSRERVRLLGVDRPELDGGVSSDTGTCRACLGDWAGRTRAFPTVRLANASVRVATDLPSPRRGDFGRLLAYVDVAGANRSFYYGPFVRGYARVYESEVTRLEIYQVAAAAARGDDWGWTCTV